jgi:hypothetical protein
MNYPLVTLSVGGLAVIIAIVALYYYSTGSSFPRL